MDDVAERPQLKIIEVPDEVREAFERANIPVRHFAIAHPDRLHPNPWNQNRMDDRTFEATKESMATYGQVMPTLVRPHPELEGDFQIVDGEHRWRAIKEGGWDGLLIAVADLDDTAARKLTIVMNETTGQPDDVLLGNLLSDIRKEEGDGLMNALRWSPQEVDHLLSLASDDWSSYDPPDPDLMASRRKGGQVFIVTAKLEQSFVDVWERSKRQVAELEELELDDDPQIANGQVLNALVQRYLADHGGD